MEIVYQTAKDTESYSIERVRKLIKVQKNLEIEKNR